jgi:hypothetical protein
VLTKIFLFFAVSLVASCFIATAHDVQNLKGKIELKLYFPKTIFHEGENGFPELEIINISKETLELNQPIERLNLYTFIEDTGGKKVPYGISYDSFGRDEIIVKYFLLPAESTFVSLSFTAFSNVRWNWSCATGVGLSAGKYKFSVTYENVTSESVEFVITPATSEDIEIENRMQTLISSNTERNIEYATELIKDFPKSIYIPNFYHLLLLNLEGSNKRNQRTEGVISTAEEFLERYPMSGQVFLVLQYYIKALKIQLGIDPNKFQNITKDSPLQKIVVDLKNRHPEGHLRYYMDRYLSTHVGSNK